MRLSIFLPFLFLMIAHAQAQDERCQDECYMDRRDFYAKAFGGANFLQNTTIKENRSSYQVGYVVAGSLGYYCRDYDMRLEAEYAFRSNPINNMHFITEGSSKHGHFHASSYMANLLWDVPVCRWGFSWWNIQPFIGAGIGYDHQHMHASNSRIIFSQKWNHFSWQVMAGYAYPIFRNVEMTVEYKFHQGGGHFYNHAIGVGFVYKCGSINGLHPF